MRYIIFFLIISCYSLFMSGAEQVVYSEVIDRIVAVVNDEPITKSELDGLLAPIYEQYRDAYSGQVFMEKINEARTNILNQLIEDKLVSQEAKRLGVQVAEEEIDAQIDEIKKKFGDEFEFRTYIEAQGLTISKLREKFKEQISIRKLHQFEINQKIIVSPLQIKEYYNEHIDDFSTKEKVKVRTIMLRKSSKEKAKPEQVQANEENDNIVTEKKATVTPLEKAKKILVELNKGASFSEYAKEFSEGQNSEGGGDLGFVKNGELIKEFNDVIFSLPVGSISEVIESPIGYHIFLVEAKQEKKIRNLEEVKDEIKEILFKQKTKERFKKWMSELKENAYISIK